MPEKRTNLKPTMNEKGQVEEVKLVETPSQRRKRLAKEAREKTLKQEGLEKPKKSIKHDYMPETFPWDSIRDYFVHGAPDAEGNIHYPTTQEVMNYYHCSFSMLRLKILEEDWLKQRDEWRLSLQKQIREVTMFDYVAAANKFDSTCIEVAQTAMNEIANKFREYRAKGDPVPSLELDRLGRSAINYQRLGRLSLGLSTENTATKEMKVSDSLQNIDLSMLTNDELQQVKQLLQKAETLEESKRGIEHSEDDVVEGIVVEQNLR